LTARDRAAWLRAQRRAASLSPDIGRAVMRALNDLRESLSVTEMTRLIESGRVDQIIDDAKLKSFEQVSEAIQQAAKDATKQFAKDLPRLPSVGFNILNPDIIDAIRALDTKVVQSLTEEVRDMVLAHVENGLRSGKAPAAIARTIRPLIGLGPKQLEQADVLRSKLEAKGLPDARIDKLMESYTKRRIRHNANTISRTASMDAMKQGQKLSVQSAVDQGIYDPNRLVKTWVGVMDEREREEHVRMEKETVPYNGRYSNGQDVPGESDYNCRCISRFSQKAA
jgi:hypothetical protein